ncbi:MAG: insulinase family protein [Candidatus Sericytochromatia bacterium]|nr:insulinase family protein [Candidatus Tanganyikabacteria bacterium]
MRDSTAAFCAAAALAVSQAGPALAAPLAGTLPVTEHVLPNGLKVLMLERHTAPVVSFQVWYRVGSRNEDVGKSGVSHLLEHLLFQGSKHFPAGAYDRTVERHGGNNNAFTTEDYTAYYVNFPSDKLELAARLEADRMTGALVPAAKFASELGVVKEERRWRTDNDPFGMMWEMLGATAYAAHPYRWPIVGWMSDLDAMTHADAVAYYKAHYQPNNAVVVVVGDFETSKALDVVKKTFGALPRGPVARRAIPQEPPQKGERRTEVIRDVATPAVMLAYHMGPKGGADFFPLAVIDRILSSGRSSRLHHDLVYTRKWAQEVGTNAGENADPGLFLAYAVPMPGRTAADLESELIKALDRLKTEDVADRELQKAINQVEAKFYFSQQKNYALGTAIGSAEAQGSWRFVNDYVTRIRAVTKADIRRVAAQTFTRQNRSVITLVPAKELQP